MLDKNNTDAKARQINITSETSNDQDETLLHQNEDPYFAGGSGAQTNVKSSNASTQKRQMSKVFTASYVEKNRFGVVADDSEEEDEEILELAVGATPNTRRRIIKTENVKKQKKLGPLATAFTIFKGFVATGILYMPADFVDGGYGFSGISVIAALFLTLYCAKLLLEVYESVGGHGNSLPDIGQKVYGKPGKIAVEISLFGSQFGFVCAYIYFIASQIGGEGGIIQCITVDQLDANGGCTGGTMISKWWFLLVCMCIYVPLVFVRKIEVFAITHLFGDIMILITVVAVLAYAGINVSDNGWQTQNLQFVTSDWSASIGFSVYAFEGIGIILPVLEVTERPDIYFRTLTLTCLFIAAVYVGFSLVCVFGYGAADLTKPLITESLPRQSGITYFVKIAFSLNLVFSYPLVIHPANLVLESYLFASWPKSRKRQMAKNISRTCIVAASCVVALLVYDKLTQFLGITGALTCTPIAFTLPALFHYKQCAKTRLQKVIDLTIVAVTLMISVYCTTLAVINF